MRLPLVVVSLFASALVLAGCASSPGGNECDPAIASCACTPGEVECPAGYECAAGVCEATADGGGSGSGADAGEFIDAGPMFDAAPKKGFGELCGDKAECASNICILVGIGGICTETCVGNSCPTEYGCFGVFGAIEPGQVADVCVPDSNQLCTVCDQSSECAIVGMDQCLSYDNGKKFCSRDCTTVACPSGYGCEDVDVGGTMFKQCIPASGACDCNAMLMGAVDPCSITTPFGTCNAARTCEGATGWSACLPPSPTDAPDATFTDDNCDGIDGDMAYGIFVATTGTDSATCGLTFLDPCATINQGILRAAQTPTRGDVYVQAGVYAGTVVLINGVNIYGGYDANWQRASHTTTGHTVTISGGLDNLTGGDNQYIAIRAHGLIVPTLVADVRIEGPDATGSVAGNGKSSYAVHVDGANVSLTRVTIVGGNGASGDAGVSGSNAPSVNRTAGMNGGTGGNANENSTFCNDSSRGAAGSAGANSCSGGSVVPSAGSGGAGGTMDSDCSFPYDFDARAGSVGQNASYVDATYGRRGTAGGTCQPGGAATVGRVINGIAGTRNTGGALSPRYWYARTGGDGQAGDHGSGGGGGGGSGGCDDGIDSWGAGGGGGGAGGCRALSGGTGGGGGGGSFGLFVVGASTVTASNCQVVRGNGGSGGGGGSGGRGQSGGLAGSGGLADGDSKVGGAGAAGAHGGHGGGGAGGAGGRSVGVFIRSGATVTHDCTYAGGSGGVGGAGGVAGPGAPVGENDGNPGQNGLSGGLSGELVCTADDAC